MDKLFKALADKHRRMIVTLLKNKGEMSVNEILKYFDITQATLSSHLIVLKKANLVNFKIAGKKRIYTLNRELFLQFVSDLNKFIGLSVNKVADEVVVRNIRH
jgi:ArsR family transcriptional regulator